ncbi:caspase domain-containing protein [Desarmillaria tabescens]|uniref:Caspase domain-containing protein n=1 Tax=Armillaria tabescens TaxID=1929756 RepID=A0AA39N424_ARMTA|nr:caspase domain-containing protein [Desarmillaria tabescens]KAK0457426.1 caspase domain-containing protein [Desarmillaria tabescens]
MIFGSRLIRSLASSPSHSLTDLYQPFFGRKVQRKALLIGISYVQEEYRSNPELQLPQGLQRDVDGIRTLLEDRFEFKKEDITVLTDFPGVPRDQWPTKTNIETAIQDFVDGVKAGDIRFLFYAGHGHQIHNDNSREDDKRDEHIVPCDAVGPDFIAEKMIIDDFLKNTLVMPLAAADANLTAVFDCCHSGTVLDLSHYRCNDCTSWTSNARRIYRHVFSTPSVNLTLMVPFTINMFRSAASIYLDPHIEDCKGFCSLSKRKGPGYVCISACRDGEQAWGGTRGGALTRAFIQALEHNPKLTLKELNVFLHTEVTIRSKNAEKRRRKQQKADPSKMVQRLQISSLWPLDMNQNFML